MDTDAVGCAERATSDLLIGPDWSLNIELCDLIDRNPGQTGDVMKVLKKRLVGKVPKAQLLTLYVLETLSKNCGDIIFQSILENDILTDIVNVVKTKPDWNVMDKALMLIDIWQEGLGGPSGRYPQYFAAYNDLKRHGVRFPPREEASVPLFTPAPPQLPHSDTSSTHIVPRSSLPSDASNLSAAEMKSAQLSADLLLEMLGALDPRKPEALEEEIIVDLLGQCRSYQESVMLLLNTSDNEQILHQGLALNDRLQKALCRHEDLVKAVRNAKAVGVDALTRPISTANPPNDELDEGFDQIKRRSSGDIVPHKKATSVGVAASSRISPILPPPPSSSRPVHKNSTMIDFLSGDPYTVEVHHPSADRAAPVQTTGSSAQNSSPFVDKSPTTSPFDPWEAAFPSAFNPAPSGGHGGLQQHSLLSTSSSDHINEPGTSTDAITDGTQKLSLRSSESEKKVGNKEVVLFDDLLDLAKFR
ncbi:hypothetical protein MLD38_022476 [Melastoma candidum]|uniref:Uncharacterized protein n=1 Tax=Melastoma candidum TaxID=119954 RepID=A0ACB9QNA1_9MYRT|nr:hypothetical protein MLD38_022476 [Melastoma candidum]